MRYNITKNTKPRNILFINIVQSYYKSDQIYQYTRTIKYERLQIQIDLKRIGLQITLYKYLIKYSIQVNDIQKLIHTYTQYKRDRERDNEHKIFTW